MRTFPEGESYIPNGAVEYTRGFIGGFYIRPFEGVVENRGHAHHIDHPTLLLKDDVWIHWKDPRDGRKGTVLAEGPKVLGDLPLWIPIKAEMEHWIQAVRPGKAVWACVFAEAEAMKYADADGVIPFAYHMGPG